MRTKYRGAEGIIDSCSLSTAIPLFSLSASLVAIRPIVVRVASMADKNKQQ